MVDTSRGRSPRLLFVNSTIAFAFAVLAMFTIHEFGHALVALLIGVHPVVRAFSGDIDSATNTQYIVVDIAGPLISLISGVLILLMPRVGRNFSQLFWLWLGLLSVQECANYFVSAPFIGMGDVYDTLHRLDSPWWVAVILFVPGCVTTFLLARVAVLRFAQFMDPALDFSTQIGPLGIFAWLMGSLVATILSIGSFDSDGGGLFEMFGLFASGGFLLLIPFFMPMSVSNVKINMQREEFRFPLVGSLLLLALALARLTILSPGLHLV